MLAVRPTHVRSGEAGSSLGPRRVGPASGAGVPLLSGDQGRLGRGPGSVRAVRWHQAVGHAGRGGVPGLRARTGVLGAGREAPARVLFQGGRPVGVLGEPRSQGQARVARWIEAVLGSACGTRRDPPGTPRTRKPAPPHHIHLHHPSGPILSSPGGAGHRPLGGNLWGRRGRGPSGLSVRGLRRGPPLASILWRGALSSAGERRPYKAEVPGSKPGAPTEAGKIPLDRRRREAYLFPRRPLGPSGSGGFHF